MVKIVCATCGADLDLERKTVPQPGGLPIVYEVLCCPEHGEIELFQTALVVARNNVSNNRPTSDAGKSHQPIEVQAVSVIA